MQLEEYVKHDGFGLADLVRSGDKTPVKLAATENVLYGNTSMPWKPGYSAGGSTAGDAAAVTTGIVPLAHGSDIGGSIRIPAGWCGGVGLKLWRGRVSVGPAMPRPHPACTPVASLVSAHKARDVHHAITRC